MTDLTVQVAGLNLSAGHDPPEPPESATPSTTILFPPRDATAIDEDGDLYLIVGDKKRAFQVDSRALVRVSSVWKAMVRYPDILYETSTYLHIHWIAYRHMDRI